MKKGTPLFDHHSRKKKKDKPPEPIGKEDPQKKLQWILEQKAFIWKKPIRSADEIRWLNDIDDRITLLRIACA